MTAAILIILLAVVAPNWAGARALIDRTLVTVNDEVVLESDIVEFQKKLHSKSFQELFGGVRQDVLTDTQKTLRLLIEEKIIDQQVRRLELRATDPEIDAQIRSILKRNGISTAQLTERLKQLGTTLTEYRDGIRRQVERKNLLDREIRPTLEVSEEQVRHFYLRLSQNSTPEREFKIAHILIDVPKANLKAAESKAKALFDSLQKSPEKFESLAQTESTDSSTAAVGGALGSFTTSALAKEFRDIIPKVPSGHVAPPIRTAAGIHLIKVLDVKISDFSSLSKDKKDSLRNRLLEEEMDRKMQLWLERKRTESYIRFSGENNEG